MDRERHTDMTRRALLKTAGIAAAGLAALGRFFGTAWGKEHSLGRKGLPPSQLVSPPEEQRSAWARLTKRMRRIISVVAQEEAARFGTRFVGPEHLLLAMIRESDCRGARVLHHLGIDLDQVRMRIELRSPREQGSPGLDMMLAPTGKLVIDDAMTEARLLEDNYVGSEHLLLGLLKDEGLAGQVLHRLGATTERVRRALKEE
jgi:hypothetical protein